MNPNEKQKYMIGAFILLCVFGMFFSLYSYSSTTVLKEITNKVTGAVTTQEVKATGYLWTTFFLAVILVIFLVRFSKIEIPTTMVRFEEGVEAYRKYLGKHHSITIPETFEIYWTDADHPDWYKTILTIPNSQDGGCLYYPIEINKIWQMDANGESFILFGEGQGVETDNINKVGIFKLKKKSQQPNQMENKIKDLIIEQLNGGNNNV